jgi:hypothetical protein
LEVQEPGAKLARVDARQDETQGIELRGILYWAWQ